MLDTRVWSALDSRISMKNHLCFGLDHVPSQPLDRVTSTVFSWCHLRRLYVTSHKAECRSTGCFRFRLHIFSKRGGFDGGCQALLTAPVSVAVCDHCWRCRLRAGHHAVADGSGVEGMFPCVSAGSLGRPTLAPCDCCPSAFQLPLLAPLSDLV